MSNDREIISGKFGTLFSAKMRDYLLLVTMLLTQFTLHYSLRHIAGTGEVSMLGRISFYIAELCFLTVDVYLVVWVLRSNRRRKAVENLREIRYELEQERIRWAGLDTQRENLARIRHDYNNQLDTIRYLMDHDPEAAKEMTASLLRTVREERKNAGGEDRGSCDL